MMKRRILLLFVMIFGLMVLSACGEEETTVNRKKTTKTTKSESTDKEKDKESKNGNLIICSPHNTDFSEPIIDAFEKETGINVQTVENGTGELLTKIENEKDAPTADIMWGGTVVLLSTKKELFEKYKSSNESKIIDEYKNKTGNITSFTIVPSVLMVNTDLTKNIEIKGYQDLLNPELKGKIAHCDPSKSSSSYEQVVNMLNAMGNGKPQNGWGYVKKLVSNLDGKLLEKSSQVYDGVAEGKFAVGLTYEEGAVKHLKQGAPVKVIYMKEGVISRADGVAIIKSAPNMENAKKFVDFATSKKAQELVVDQLYRRSVRSDVEPVEGLIPYNDIKMLNDDAQWAADNKESILKKFSSLLAK